MCVVDCELRAAWILRSSAHSLTGLTRFHRINPATSCQSCLKSKRKLHRQLHLSRIAHALPQEPVKVKQSRRHERIDVVGVVERIEHLDYRNDREAFV